MVWIRGVNIVGGLWRRKRGRVYRINAVMPQLYERTMLYVLLIRKINAMDDTLSPKEQAQLIKDMDGLEASEMEELIPVSGPTLADSIRAVISKHRATNRSDKDQNRR